MSISHWGLFPGWWEPVPEPNGAFKIGAGSRIRWCTVDFDVLCSALQNTEDRQLKTGDWAE